MGLFGIFKKDKFDVDVRSDGIFIGGVNCEFDLAKFNEALGQPRVIDDGEGKSRYFWDEAGIFAFVHAGELAEPRLTEIVLMLEVAKGVQHEVPHKLYGGAFTLEGRPPIEAVPEQELRGAYIFLELSLGKFEVSLALAEAVQERIGAMDFAERFAKRDTDEIADIVRAAKMPIGRVCINQKEKKLKPRPSDKFKLPRTAGETLAFKNFNFKIAVMNELMYEKALLQPKFDVFEYCEERGIDPYADFGALPQAKKWFKDYPVPADLAEQVSELYLDGGNEIYLQIAPDWDGEDDLFDIKNIDAAELTPFINLKKIETTGIGISKKARKTCADAGIAVVD